MSTPPTCLRMQIYLVEVALELNERPPMPTKRNVCGQKGSGKLLLVERKGDSNDNDSKISNHNKRSQELVL